MLAMELKDIERDKFNRSLTKRQISELLPLSINCAIQWFYT